MPDGLGECRSFSIVQISYNQIYQNSIQIKSSKDVYAYINKLSNSANHSGGGTPTVIDLSGQILDYSPTTTSTSTISTKAQSTTNVAYISDKKYLI